MPKKTPPIDIEQLTLLVGPMGQPIKMVAETLGVTEYRVKKTIKDNEIEKCEDSYMGAIIERAFKEELDQREFIKQRALASKLFKVAPDIRFWRIFDFNKYAGKYTCLTYFLTGFLKTLKFQYEAFEKTVNDDGVREGAIVIAKKVFPDKDFTKPNTQYLLADAAVMYAEIPDISFWKSFNLMGAFPNYEVGSLKYFHTEQSRKTIKESYNKFNYNPPSVESVKLQEDKIGQDAHVRMRMKSTIDFLNS